MYNEKNPYWGFDPSGNPLGGSGFEGGLGGHQAPSKPYGPQNPGLGDPVAATNRMGNSFIKRFDQRYEAVSHASSKRRNPEEINAQVSDYQDGAVDPWAEIRDWEAESKRIVESGNPQLGAARPKNSVNFPILAGEGSGLSQDKAQALYESLSQYDPGVVEGIQVPMQTGLPSVASDLGLVAKGPESLRTFQNDKLQPDTVPGFGDVAARIAAAKPSHAQRVDDNGVVQKYAPGTGPYDAFGTGRPGGILGAKPGTRLHSASASAARMRTELSGLSDARGTESGMVTADDIALESGGRVTAGHIIGGIGLGLLGVLGLSLVGQGASK